MRRFEIVFDDKAYLVEVTKLSSDGALVTVNGTPHEVGIKEITAAAAHMPEMIKAGAPPSETAPAASSGGAAQAEVETVGGVTTIKAPLPGLILSVKAAVGDTVKVNDVLLVIETMKMENNIMSPVAGTVREIKVSPNDNVSEGTPLVVIGE